MLRIWGRTNSINVMKVLWCADELGLRYERIDAGMAFGVVGDEWYGAMNPNRRVPTIDDDGLVLWESNTIVRYLAAKHAGAGLWPADPGVRATGEKWMDWQLSMLMDDMTPLFWGLVRKAPQHQDPDKLASAASSVGKRWAMLDAALADRDYVAGERFTVGDIPVGCFVWRWSQLPIERPALPHLEAWHERLQARPAFREHVMLPLT
jgi:glutathione S-transferase